MSNSKKNQEKSDRDELPSIESMLKNLKIPKDNRDINILLLGETGVGKSTFINAFLNYISFASLSQAKNGKFQVVIPSQFTITDENYKERVIKVGEDHNESIEVGASATQACRSYVYPVKGSNLKIRLIDTPGVGDTRGIEQDNVNFENVLSFIGELKYLNAICILLKPNNSRLTVMFEFCIKQLLSRLEKSASENLIFVFTNTRSTFYRPGETLPSLKKLLGTVKGVDIACDKKNIFCTDNESFRFLAALKNKVQFTPTAVNNFSQSWTQSYEECLRMIKYIVGDANNPGIVPHDVKNTISVNEARRLIVQLSQPLAEIAQLINDNIRAVDAHKDHLKFTTTSLTELRSKLYIPIIDLKVTKLNQPTTVCTSVQCSKVYEVGGKKKWHYHQKCHSPCYLSNVPKEIIGSPELINCAAMNPNGECHKCSCRYQVHMHIYYETEAFENRLEDELVKTKIVTKEQAIQSAQNLSLKLSNRLWKLNKERETIIKTTAKFACFLKMNAITPYNDAYEAYLEYLIDREKSMGDVTDYELIKQLERILREYFEEKSAILNAMSEAQDGSSFITADEIISSIQRLYSLELFGDRIREMVEAQNRARKDENKSETKEFVLEEVQRALQFRVRGPGGRGRQQNLRVSTNRSQNYNQNPWSHPNRWSNENAWRNPNPHHGPQYGSNVVVNQDGLGNIEMKVYPSHSRNYYDPPRTPEGMNYPYHNYPEYSYNRMPPPPAYSSHPPYTQPPSLFQTNYQPPNNYSVTNTERPARRGSRGGGRPKSYSSQPGYYSEPETKQRRNRNCSRPNTKNKRHNLNASSSSSDEDYFSSSDRRRE
ncbi:hypothetical protein RN001_014857 [Aquatica leii]|uniref:G domain-containing protein n=1 Tax=Aquatica leii TaxID=1421715 RepID=A0AAN7P129_9COLE|nr:hypothetical protein RN001_014857 [Aquatica leii]